MTSSLKLPPFPALRGFEAAARLQSFRLAAEELCLSPSAISHHVRQLEEFVGIPLFERSPTGVKLTRRGQSYLKDLAPIFETLANATSKVKHTQYRQQVTLCSSPGFAARWLMPRLRRLKRCVPDADLTLTTNDTDTHNADLEFRCAYTYPLEKDDQVLLSSVRSPVCSPRYLEEHGPIDNPEQLKDHTLLREHHFDAWEQWLSLAAPNHEIEATELWFDDGYASMHAAELGLGIQLGYLEFLEAELADGRLIQLFEQTAPKKTLFALRTKNGWQDNVNVVAIRNWLLEEMHNAEQAFS